MQKQKSAYNQSLRLIKLTLNAQKTIDRQLRKIKITPIRSTGIETRIKTKLSLRILLLLIVSLRPKSSKKISVKKAVKEAIQPLGSMPSGQQKKVRIRPRISAISNATLVSRKVTMLTSALKSPKASDGLGNLYVND